MRVEFLGTSGFYPTEQRHTSCVFLPAAGIVFDAGTGMFRLPNRLQTKHIDIFLSHSHLDHIVGLTYLLPHIVDGRLESAAVHGSATTIEAIREHLFASEIFPVRIPFEFVELTEPREVAGGRLTFREQAHPGGSLGYRIDWPDRSLAYVTDTNSDVQEIEFIRHVDLLIHECTYPDGHEEIAEHTGHSTTTPVCTLARDAAVKRLLLTHFDPYLNLDDPVDLEKARNIFTDTDIAQDELALEF